MPAASLEQLVALLERARSAEASGDLEWLDGGQELRGLRAGMALPPGPGPLTCRWLCSGCSRVFLLELRSRHSLGDGWRPLFGN